MNLPLRRLPRPRRTSDIGRSLSQLTILLAIATGSAEGVEPALKVQSLPEGRVQISWTSTASSFVLEHSGTLQAPIPWQAVGETVQTVGDRNVVEMMPENQARFFRLREDVPALVGVVETSPRFGETGVSVTREAVFRFNAPLAPDSLLTGAGLFAEYGGRQLLTRAELSGDRRSATLFLLENMPASSQVRVTLDSNGLRDGKGRLIDADGDGTPGGVRVLEFSTAGITALPGTSVFGKVYASEKNPDGSNRPLENVTITVDGAEESVRATTDASGGFVLNPAPAGRFFVHVDGRTAAGSAWPGGAYYPFVGKAWEAVPGSTNNAAGGSGEIFLPLIVEGSLKEVSASEVTKVTFSPVILAANPALNGVEINVPANSLFSDTGARGGKMGMVPVPPNRLPEPLPDGLKFPLVITVQTDGGSNFDRPVPVRFPNLPDPATGVKLPPGAKTALWSFNHDTGRWEVQGSMTISADGLFAVSDAGVGIRQPGWHGTNPGGSGTGPEGCQGDDCDGPKCGAYPPSCCADWPTFKAPCQLKQDLALSAIQDLAVDDFLFLLGARVPVRWIAVLD